MEKLTFASIGFCIGMMIMMLLIVIFIKPNKSNKTVLPTNTTIKVKDFDCYGLIVDSSYNRGKYYTLRYQINTGEIINQSFHDWELDTISWTNFK